MNNYVAAAIQGAVQGLTEFLPVSSTGHMILVGDLIGFEGEVAKVFEVVVQLGTILAVALIYRSKIVDMLKNWKASPFSGEKRLTIWHIFTAMIPAVIMGLLFHKTIKTKLFTPETVIIGLIAGGILMIFAEKTQKEVKITDFNGLSLGDCFKIGLFQCLALWPGFSRSGSTMAGALILGAAHRPAADFSFILAIPMMISASVFDLWKSRGVLSSSDVGYFSLGFFVAFVVGWLAVEFFLKFLERVKLTPFAWYRFAVALIALVVILSHPAPSHSSQETLKNPKSQETITIEEKAKVIPQTNASESVFPKIPEQTKVTSQ
ncbi:MAG: undecaprenyl-diphosphate phosphatase [Candidatus Riflebacteria bacterium]|nr:undecaprenyl-diphosphate phosphatase [Candidatus Riflebacteria bacterium]